MRPALLVIAACSSASSAPSAAPTTVPTAPAPARTPAAIAPIAPQLGDVAARGTVVAVHIVAAVDDGCGAGVGQQRECGGEAAFVVVGDDLIDQPSHDGAVGDRVDAATTDELTDLELHRIQSGHRARPGRTAISRQ